MRKAYFITLVVVTILTLTFAAPGMGLVALLFTFGLALIILGPLPYIFFTLWAALPAVMFWKTPLLRWPLLGLGALLMAATLYLPPYLADAALARDLANRGDISPTPVAFDAPIGIEIRRRAQNDPDLHLPKSRSRPFFALQQPCFEHCERLLTGGDVAWVRIVLTDDAFANDRKQTHALFVPGDAEICRAVNPDFGDGQPCVLFAPDHGLPAALTLALDEDRTNWRIKGYSPYQPMGFRSAVAHSGPDTDAPVVMQATQIFHERPNSRIAYDFGSLGSGDGGGGFMYPRTRAATDPIDLAQALTSLGLSLGPKRALPPKMPETRNNIFIAPPPDAQDAAYVASLISTGPERDESYSNAFGQVVNSWHDRLRWKPAMTNSDRSTFCATLDDTRIRNLFWDDQVVSKHQVSCP